MSQRSRVRIPYTTPFFSDAVPLLSPPPFSRGTVPTTRPFYQGFTDWHSSRHGRLSTATRYITSRVARSSNQDRARRPRGPGCHSYSTRSRLATSGGDADDVPPPTPTQSPDSMRRPKCQNRPFSPRFVRGWKLFSVRGAPHT